MRKGFSPPRYWLRAVIWFSLMSLWKISWWSETWLIWILITVHLVETVFSLDIYRDPILLRFNPVWFIYTCNRFFLRVAFIQPFLDCLVCWASHSVHHRTWWRPCACHTAMSALGACLWNSDLRARSFLSRRQSISQRRSVGNIGSWVEREVTYAIDLPDKICLFFI